MIKYALVCENSHEFESWFPDSAAYDSQSKRGLVACPECGSVRNGKAIMAPSVARRDRQLVQAEPSPPPAEGAPQPVALIDERQKMLRAMMRELRSKIMENTDDVGSRFPEQARRMHEGEIPARSIRGEATLEEARLLVEDGIDIMPMPHLPDELN
jgi:hypothetical protein